MKHISILFMFLCVTAHASDWKIGGYATGANGKQVDLFYDADKVVKSNGTVRFWIKSINDKKLNYYKNDKNIDKLIIDEAAKKIVNYYSPPIFSTTRFQKAYKNSKDYGEASIEGVLTETIVNNKEIPIESEMFWEINCKNNQYKIIEFHSYDTKGNLITKNNVDAGQYKVNWANISPDSNTESWHELFCKD